MLALAAALGHTQGIFGGAFGARPDREKEKDGKDGDTAQQRITRKSRDLGRGNSEARGSQGQHNEPQRGPTPGAGRHAYPNHGHRFSGVHTATIQDSVNQTFSQL
jgi:hypothetical protein